MKQTAYVAGVGMTPFGNAMDKTLNELAASSILDAIKDAGITKEDLNAAYMGNAAGGVITGQVCVPGQVALRSMGISKIPVVNIENACATSATAFQQACTMVTLGVYDVVLVCGYEKLYHEDKNKTFSVFTGAIDVTQTEAIAARLKARNDLIGESLDMSGAGSSRSIFIDIYATWAREHMHLYGTTREQLAAVSAKNSVHGSLNPKSQFQNVVSVEEVLSAREIVSPLTLPMCAPIGDGAASVIVVSERMAKKLGKKRCIRVNASNLHSGWDAEEGETPMVTTAVTELYEQAGLGAEDLNCVELHDASAISEIKYYEYLGLCETGAGGDYVLSGASSLGGKVPVNTSGGLMRKGHPIGATGAAQIVELVMQLRGEAGKRQVSGARVALAENGGGYIGTDAAALVLSILSKEE
ncbi:Acetyl-CoA acetyltransferase [Zhongshania aliphaticivorans]|uniref:Acetyl-CoA acetyltransferase n=1 Tax=Zhongshania aliphaticivorans TaxID=1470434 RepID=A0A5S9QAE4_9GAMM|nr:thiolase family protein [Zhongshania aliphaticivorans]CAA0114662.1 Acetyl-CoA acetyltransferase [Zhongshania aliphaticivorans]CAA0122975.1 Acetyl-CoA acetyltransferase [Zhongshania aliphaticivorans]